MILSPSRDPNVLYIMTDEEPPLVSTGADGPAANLIFNTVPGAGYDVLGRTFFIGANVEF